MNGDMRLWAGAARAATSCLFAAPAFAQTQVKTAERERAVMVGLPAPR